MRPRFKAARLNKKTNMIAKSKTIRIYLVVTGLLLVLIFVSIINIREAAYGSGESIQDIPFDYVLVDGNGPTDVYLKSFGDINGDGLPDLIAGGQNGGGLVWYENPTWVKHTIVGGGNHTTDGEVADIDDDGDVDVVGLTSSSVVWYENPGWTVHNIDNEVLHDIEVADFDQDGDIDVVGRNQSAFGGNGEQLHFYRQDSPTSWTHHIVTIPAGEGLATADIDFDNDIDVIIGGHWYENDGVIVNGSWSEHSFTTSWVHEDAFVDTGDINGDDRLDIVLSPSELEGQIYRISWFEAPVNPRDGNWVEHIIDGNVEAVHHFVGVADMNNDGLPDVATAEMHQSNDPDEVKVYLNENNGVSWIKQVLATTGSHSMRLVDVEKDGDIDLYGANWIGNDVELWVNGSCETQLDQWQRHVIDNSKPWQSVFVNSADLNEDGLMDIVTGGWWYQNPGTPGGSWVRRTIGSPLNNMAALMDFDGDGYIDILGTEGQGSQSNDSFVWAKNNGLGTFTILNNIENGDGDFLQGVTIGDFQSGANSEVLLSWHEPNKGIQRLTIPDNPGINTWLWDQVSTISQDEDLSSGDIDSDGDLDLLLGTLWLRNDGSSWSSFTLSNAGGNPDRNELIDMNNDNKLDAVVGFEAISQPGLLAWYEQGANPTELWTQHIISNTIVGPMSLDVADMDFDGDFDVVAGEHNLADPASARLFIFENLNGEGTSWDVHLVYEGDEHHDGARLVDIDEDGDLDIMSIGWGHGRVHLYENKGANCAPPPGTPTPTPTTLPPTATLPPGITPSPTAPATSTPTVCTPTPTATQPAPTATPAGTGRVTDGLVALYLFEEGGGNILTDTSGAGSPLNLRIDNGGAVNWLANGGLQVVSPTIIQSDNPATKVIQAATASNELTIETWVVPHDNVQNGPARIISLSEDPLHRNFTLGQESNFYDFRLRATSTDDNGIPAVTSPPGSATQNLTHIVYTRDPSGMVHIYLDNGEVASDIRDGNLSNWDTQYQLALANELTNDRPWRGVYHLVAIYDRALTEAEVDQNFAAGPRPGSGIEPTATPVIEPSPTAILNANKNHLPIVVHNSAFADCIIVPGNTSPINNSEPIGAGLEPTSLSGFKIPPGFPVALSIVVFLVIALSGVYFLQNQAHSPIDRSAQRSKTPQ